VLPPLWSSAAMKPRPDLILWNCCSFMSTFLVDRLVQPGAGATQGAERAVRPYAVPPVQ
jgi:hypothetical protein